MSAALLTKRQVILPGSLQLSPKRRCKIRHFCLQISGICTCKKHPFEKDVIFLFCGRRNDRIKALVWEGDGFLLLYKRVENGRFKWPRSSEELMNLNARQFECLLSGFAIEPGIKMVSPPEKVI